MANIYTHSTSAVAFPTAEYDDRYISVNQAQSNLEQGFLVNKIDALSGAKDSSINNYSLTLSPFIFSLFWTFNDSE